MRALARILSDLEWTPRHHRGFLESAARGWVSDMCVMTEVLPEGRSETSEGASPPLPSQGEDVRSQRLQQNEMEPLHILRRVSHEAVWGLLERLPVRCLTAGDTLLTKGQSNQTMYLLLKGELRVHLDSPDGDPVAMIDAGQAVGELSVLDDSPASAYVVAASDARVLEIEETTFWRLVAASHEFATNLLLLLAHRMRANNSTIRENARLRRQLEIEATVDTLTGLRNRRWVEKSLPRLVQRHCFAGDPLSAMMIDVDHFKRFNDTFGHCAGDVVLATVARTITDKLRPTDIGARFGGEEFVVVLPGTDCKGAVAAAERLRMGVAAVRASAEDGRELPPVTISIGVAQLDDSGDLEDLLGRADAALYHAKACGRNCVSE